MTTSQLASNPMRVIATDTIPVTVFKSFCKIHHFEFQKAAAADSVAVTDINGNHVWDFVAPADDEPGISQEIGDINGLIVSAMTSTGGELLIYFR